MTLREMISTAYAMIGDIAEEKVERGEMVQFLNDAQQIMGNFLVNIVRQKFARYTTIDLVSGTELYDLPNDFSDPIRVRYNGIETNWRDVAQLGALERNKLHLPVANRQHFYYVLGGSGPFPQIGLRPVPSAAAAAGLELWYYRRPTPFRPEGMYEGTLAASAGISLTKFKDPGMPYAAAAEQAGEGIFWDNGLVRFTKGKNSGIERRVTQFEAEGSGDYFNTTSASGANTQVFSTEASSVDDTYNGLTLTFLSGTLSGESQTISDYVGSTGEFTTAAFSGNAASGDTFKVGDGNFGVITLESKLPNLPVNTDEYEIDQVSSIPDEYHHLVVLYAASLAAPKAAANRDELYGTWMEAIKSLTAKYTENVAPPLSGDVNHRSGR